MFNLNEEIAQWRRQMLAAGIETPAPLNELESHLREDVEQQMRSGLAEQQAFAIALQRIGPANALKTEFQKAGGRKKALPRIVFGLIGFAFVAFIVWLSAFTILLCYLSLGEKVLAFAAVAFTLLAACSWRLAVPFLPVFPNQRTRMAVGAASILSGFVCSTLFVQILLPHFENGLDGQLPAIGLWAVFPIAVFLGLACGVQEASRRHTATTGS
jgi:hypothetical protein